MVKPLHDAKDLQSSLNMGFADNKIINECCKPCKKCCTRGPCGGACKKCLPSSAENLVAKCFLGYCCVATTVGAVFLVIFACHI